MALHMQTPRGVTCGLLAAGSIVLCACLIALVVLRERCALPGAPDGAWGEVALRASCGSITITAPSREAVHTTVSHGLGDIPVAVVLGLDLQRFDYYESVDSLPESGGPPAEVSVHLSAMVRKPYNGTFTVRLKHFLGSPRTFTMRWLAVALDSPPAAAAETRGAGAR